MHLDILDVVLLGPLVLLAAYWLYQSVYFLDQEERIVFFQFGTYRYTVVNNTYWEWREGTPQRVQEMLRKGGRVSRGILGLDIAVGLWPLYLGYRLPTRQYNVPIHASAMYTSAQYEDIPRVRVEGDGSLQLRLSDNPVYLAMVLPVFRNDLVAYLVKQARDLTRHTVLVDSDSQGRQHTHDVPLIGNILHGALDEPMQEAMRTAATSFTFSTFPGEKQAKTAARAGQIAPGVIPERADIMEHRDLFEIQIKRVLVDNEDSIFRQAELLDEHGDVGRSLLVCNIIVPLLQLQPTRQDESDAIKAIDLPFIGRQRGREQQAVEQMVREGQAVGIERLQKTLGLKTAEVAYLLDILRQSGKEVNLSSINVNDPDILAALERFMRGRTKP